jgi:riboflavin synthase
VFTGIVEEAGRVIAAERRGDVLRVRIGAGKVLDEMPVGSSIAVDGCCLTAVDVAPGSFGCDLTEETLQRTRFEEKLKPGRLVNLERPMRADGRFDGHIVQGHVDGVGTLVALRSLGESAELVVATPPELRRYLVLKGSVAVDGISLTVAGLTETEFSVAIIPFTLEVTNLREARAGDPVNLEADVIAKYVERLLRPPA